MTLPPFTQTTQPLLEDGTVIEHTVVNSTVTYTLSGKTIRWTNNKVPECDGFAYPSHPSKLLRKVYAQRASSWVGHYTPKPGANRRSCCVPQKVVISHSHEMFGILISLTKEGHDSRCFFNNDITTVHQTSALAPQGNIISKMADGQPIRFVLNGDNLLLDQPANEGCGKPAFLCLPAKVSQLPGLHHDGGWAASIDEVVKRMEHNNVLAPDAPEFSASLSKQTDAYTILTVLFSFCSRA